MTTVLDTLIIGGGISGLTIAHTLSKNPSKSGKPWQFLVTESRDRVGGNITTMSGDGFLWEEGPNSFAPVPELLQLTVDLGLKEELILADRKLPRYVYLQGKLVPVPMNPPTLIQSKLLSDRGKFRALRGALGFVKPLLGETVINQGEEETVEQFFTRHLGSEVTERLVAPFVSGVYAGDPQKLSASAAFSRVTKMTDLGGGLLAGALLSRRHAPKKKVVDPNLPKTSPGELGSFKNGLKTLPETIAHHLQERVKLNWTLTRLTRTENQTYLAEFTTPEGSQKIETRSLVLATPVYVTGEILKELQPQASQGLTEIYYPPVACVVLGYPLSAIKENVNIKAFGNLIPRGQGIRTLGSVWTSSLFPGRAPQGWQMFTNYIGGTTDPQIAELSPDEIVSIVHRDLSEILLKTDAPQPKVLTVHLWKKAIPQYHLGHHQRLEKIKSGLASLPGVYACTNYTDGVAIGDCVRRSVEQAKVIREYLNSSF